MEAIQSSDKDLEHSAFFVFDHPQCKIHVDGSGRIEFLPLNNGDLLSSIVPELEKMEMPNRKFWEYLSSFIAGMNNTCDKLRFKLAVERSLNSELNKMVEGLQKKYVYIGTSKKQAFLAGIRLGQQQHETKTTTAQR